MDKKKENRSPRQANLELLRILAMFMVLILHYLSGTGALPELGGTWNGTSAAAVMLESLCVVAVNVYVLISGYFLAVSDFRFGRILKLLSEVLFYTILIPAVLTLVGVMQAGEALSIYHIWNCIFPVESGHYWFVTAYVVMSLFSPLLNAAVKHLSRQELGTAIGGLLLFFSIGKSVSILMFATDRYGYDFGWFLVLYLIGGYLRRYGADLRFGKDVEAKENRLGNFLFGSSRRAALVYLISAAGIAAAVLFCFLIYQKTGALEYYFTVPFHYNFLLCLTGAVGLFLAFAQWELPEGRLAAGIRRLSPYAFAVYLIHGHADVMGRWTDWISRIGGGKPGEAGYFLWMIVHVLIVYACCTLLDRIRAGVFGAARRMVRRKRP